MEMLRVSKCFRCWGDLTRISAKSKIKREPGLSDDGEWSEEVEMKSEVTEGEREETSGDKPEGTHCIVGICRYLNMELGSGSGFGKVPLCENCGQVAERLTELCGELEILKMKVLDELRTFDRILNAGIQTQEMRGVEDNVKMVTLKKEMKLKSDAKLKTAIPRVTMIVNQEADESLSNSDTDESPKTDEWVASREKSSIKCTHCGQSFCHKRSLSRHIHYCPKRQHLDPQVLENLVQCSICQQRFENASKLTRHFRKAHPGKASGNTNEVECQHCKKVFTDRSALSTHHNRGNCSVLRQQKTGFIIPDLEHPIQDPEQQSVAPTEIVTSASEPIEPNRRRCDWCSNDFHVTSWWSHRNRNCKLRPGKEETKKLSLDKISVNNKKHNCGICGKGFDQATDFWRHKRQQHKAKEKKKCDLCGTEVNYGHFARHRKIHFKANGTADPAQSYPALVTATQDNSISPEPSSEELKTEAGTIAEATGAVLDPDDPDPLAVNQVIVSAAAIKAAASRLHSTPGKPGDTPVN